jgi:hypothetical protein
MTIGSPQPHRAGYLLAELFILTVALVAGIVVWRLI